MFYLQEKLFVSVFQCALNPGNAPPNFQQQQPNYGYPPPQHAPPPVIMMQPATQTQTSTSVNVNVRGGVGCPVCHNNSWTGTYSCCAWCLAIVCFPIGILFCCCMRKKKCTKCGYTVG
ncbi:brain protein I3 isoform X2 [Diabrotica virgifera virgifera]|uniref:Membrane protein BRI3 n=1 Tax=Diabrotica virgifera virgifera TaxID=50390 RepID=A0A6P7FEU9_DIAVI|nr:brain protein I3 isoform X2 [Diabrotica virgifera virgifera]